jgi:hypothetical protein
MNIQIVVGILIVLVVALFIWKRNTKKSGTIIYGSMGCPHTVNHVNKYPDAQFIDCTSQKCPDFVTAYPTTRWEDGKITIGSN